MKIIYKSLISPEELSNFDVHKAGVNAILSKVNLQYLNFIEASKQEKNVHIVIKNKKTNKVFRLKVFTTKYPPRNTRRGYGIDWVLSPADLELTDNDFYFAFVHINIKEINTNEYELTYRFFIVPSKKAIKYTKESFELWLNQLKTRSEDNKLLKFLLGEEGNDYPAEFETLMQEDYENNWDQLK